MSMHVVGMSNDLNEMHVQMSKAEYEQIRKKYGELKDENGNVVRETKIKRNFDFLDNRGKRFVQFVVSKEVFCHIAYDVL